MKHPRLNDFTREELEQRLEAYRKDHAATAATCRMCAADFTKNRHWQEFCSAKCRTGWHMEVKERRVVDLEAQVAALLEENAELRKRAPQD